VLWVYLASWAQTGDTAPSVNRALDRSGEDGHDRFFITPKEAQENGESC
jgi:hypothetical protein